MPTASQGSYRREESPFAGTLALSQFKLDFTALNEHYWATESALDATGRRMKQLPEGADFRAELGLNSRRFDRRLSGNSDDYLACLKVGTEWHHRLTLIMLSSAFERYLAAATHLAVASDPALTPGFPKKIDGLAVLKYGLSIADRPVGDVIRGDWNGRAAAYAKLFSPLPALDDKKGELEKIRKLRNRVAHEAGFDQGSTPTHLAVLLGAHSNRPVPDKVSSDRMKKWLGLVHDLACSIDHHLCKDFIGGFELAAIFIEWKKDSAAVYRQLGVAPVRRPGGPVEFRKFIGSTLGRTIAQDTAVGVEEFVRNL